MKDPVWVALFYSIEGASVSCTLKVIRAGGLASVFTKRIIVYLASH